MTSFTIGDQNEVHGRAMRGLSDKIDTLHAQRENFREEIYALRAAGDELAGAYLELRNWVVEGFPEVENSALLIETDTALRRWREATGN